MKLKTNIIFTSVLFLTNCVNQSATIILPKTKLTIPLNNPDIITYTLRPIERNIDDFLNVFKFEIDKDILEIEITLLDSNMKSLKINKREVKFDLYFNDLLPIMDSVILHTYKGVNYLSLEFKDFFIDYGSSKVRRLPSLIFKLNNRVASNELDFVFIDEESIPFKIPIINDFNNDSILDFSEYSDVIYINQDSLLKYQSRFPHIYSDDFHQLRFKSFIPGYYILNTENRILFYDVAFYKDTVLLMSSNF